MTTVSTIVTADSKKDGGIGHVRLEWPVTIRWNERSRSFGIGGHVGVEYAHATRKLSKNLTFQFKNREYQLTGQDKGYRLRGAQVTVCEAFDDTVTVLYKGQTLSHRVLSEGEPPIPLDDEKSLQQTVDNAKTRQQAAPKRKPDPDHPWRRSPVGKAALDPPSPAT